MHSGRMYPLVARPGKEAPPAGLMMFSEDPCSCLCRQEQEQELRGCRVGSSFSGRRWEDFHGMRVCRHFRDRVGLSHFVKPGSLGAAGSRPAFCILAFPRLVPEKKKSSCAVS